MAKHHKSIQVDESATTLGKETRLSGLLRFKNALRIQGKFDGEIDSQGNLIIDSEAVVQVSRIRAKNIIIAGTVKGNVEAQEHVELLSTAKVYGNLKASRLRIADGVVFSGNCEMIKDPSNVNIFNL